MVWKACPVFWLRCDVGNIESLTAAYITPYLGVQVSGIVVYVGLNVVLVTCPYGFFGRAEIGRI
ncbi:MAG: hypothetical protein ACI9W2_001965 [Gammaproteobacteria bacterium]